MIGFIVDDDRRQVDSAFNKTVWLPDGPVERIQYDSAYDAYWGQTGTLRSWQASAAARPPRADAPSARGPAAAQGCDERGCPVQFDDLRRERLSRPARRSAPSVLVTP